MLKRAFKKRKTYEQLLEKVEMLKSLEVGSPFHGEQRFSETRSEHGLVHVQTSGLVQAVLAIY